MKVAVLFCGQPRFFDITAEFHKKWLKNYNVDYFAHFWEFINYGPKQSEELIDKDKLENILSLFNCKSYIIENYNNLDNFIEEVDNRFKLKDRYRHGEHYSSIQALDQMAIYEKEHNFKYDVVIRIRTDYLLNNQDINELINFTCTVPTLKVPIFDHKHYTKLLSKKITQPKIGSIPTHVKSYNREGVSVFVKNFYDYYVKFFEAYTLKKQINFINFITSPVFNFDRGEQSLPYNAWHRASAMPILIYGYEKNSNIELLNYNIKRVVNAQSKNKFKTGYISHHSTPILNDYKLFNDDNSKFIEILDNYIKQDGTR